MVLEAITRRFRRSPQKETEESIEQKPLDAASEGIARTLQTLETLEWQSTYALMHQWQGIIKVMYHECPELPAGKEIEQILKHAERSELFQKAKEELGIEDDMPVHPSWLRHGYALDIDWKTAELPEEVKKFLNPSNSKTSEIQIGSHVIELPTPELFDTKTQNIFSLWAGDRVIEFLISTDYWYEGVAGRPHTDYVGRLRFLRPTKKNPDKLVLNDPANFDQFGEGKMPVEKALLVSRLLQFAVNKSSVQQEVQSAQAWE